MLGIFDEFPHIVIEISTKADGPMGLSYQVAQDENIKNRRQKFLNKFNLKIEQIVTASLVHGNNVAIIDGTQSEMVIPNTDALVTNAKDIFLSVTLADCMPLFFFDPIQNVVALVHGGWKGIAKEIPRETVRAMTKNFSCDPKDILIGIGPHICAEHYEVKKDLVGLFAKYGKDVFIQKNGRTFLDLAKVAQIQLLSCGVREQNIEVSPDCTFKLHNTYYSYRRDKPGHLETMLAIFGIRNN